MKEYEIHIGANYRFEGGEEEGAYLLEYRRANSAAEAEEMITEELKRRGYYNITTDTVEA